MAAWGRDVRGPPRSRRPRERIRGRGRGCCSRHGPALGPPSPSPASARRSPAHRTPSLQPRRRRRRSVLRPKRRHDVLLARLRRSRLPTSLPLRFVYTSVTYISLSSRKLSSSTLSKGKAKEKEPLSFSPPTFIPRLSSGPREPNSTVVGHLRRIAAAIAASFKRILALVRVLHSRRGIRWVRCVACFSFARTDTRIYIYIYIFFFFPRYSTATPNDKFQRRERERRIPLRKEIWIVSQLFQTPRWTFNSARVASASTAGLYRRRFGGETAPGIICATRADSITR